MRHAGYTGFTDSTDFFRLFTERFAVRALRVFGVPKRSLSSFLEKTITTDLIMDGNQR